MSLNRNAKARDANEPELIEYMQKQYGALVQRLDIPFDLLVTYRSQLLQIEIKDPQKPGEIKNPTKMLTPTQRAYMVETELRGAAFFIVTNKREVDYLFSFCAPSLAPFTPYERLCFDRHFGRFLVGPEKYKSEIAVYNQKNFPNYSFQLIK